MPLKGFRCHTHRAAYKEHVCFKLLFTRTQSNIDFTYTTPNSDVIFKGFIFNGVRIKNCCQIPTKSKKVFTQSSAKIKAWCKWMHGIEDIMTKM